MKLNIPVTGAIPYQIMRHVDDETLWVALTPEGWINDVYSAQEGAEHACLMHSQGCNFPIVGKAE